MGSLWFYSKRTESPTFLFDKNLKVWSPATTIENSQRIILKNIKKMSHWSHRQKNAIFFICILHHCHLLLCCRTLCFHWHPWPSRSSISMPSLRTIIQYFSDQLYVGDSLLCNNLLSRDRKDFLIVLGLAILSLIRSLGWGILVIVK